MLERRTNLLVLSISLDLLIVVLAAGLAMLGRVYLPIGRDLPPDYPQWLWYLCGEAIVLYPLVFLATSVYDPARNQHPFDETQTLAIACFISALALAGLMYFTARNTSRLLLIYFYIVHFGLVLGWRTGLRFVQRTPERQNDYRRVLLVGGGETARQALDKFEQLAWAGIRLVGYLTDQEPIPDANGNISRLGALSEAVKIATQYQVDDVLIALPAESYRNLETLITTLISQPFNIWVIPDYFSLLLYGSQVENLGGLPMISLKAPTLTGYQRLVKRIFDLLISLTSLVVTLPLMLLIAIAIRLDSPGPVLFVQKRVGEGGRLFKMYKFRTMSSDAEKHLDDVMQYDPDGNIVHKTPHDPRVTRVGRILRRMSMDELPQLINVLRGEMSLVGPRPELPILVDHYATWQRKRFAVPQGMTGWWQINGRSDKPMHLHTEDDLYYVQNYSLLLDLEIIYKTLWVVIRGKGAY